MRVLTISIVTVLVVYASTHRTRAAENAEQRFAQAQGYYRNGFYRRADLYYLRALTLDRKNKKFLNAYAWLLATCPDVKLRNSEIAIKAGIDAVFQADEKDSANYQDTLAAAYACKGNFSGAITWQQRANGGLQGIERERGAKRLAFYMKGEAWVDLYSSVPREPVLIPRSLFENRRDIERLVAREETTAISVLGAIYLWKNTGSRPPRSFFRASSEAIAPLEYKLVSDEEYDDDDFAGGAAVLAMAATKHLKLMQQLSDAKNIERDTRCALLVEMAAGVGPKRAAEIEEFCRRNESRISPPYVAEAWRNLEFAVEKQIHDEFQTASQ